MSVSSGEVDDGSENGAVPVFVSFYVADNEPSVYTTAWRHTPQYGCKRQGHHTWRDTTDNLFRLSGDDGCRSRIGRSCVRATRGDGEIYHRGLLCHHQTNNPARRETKECIHGRPRVGQLSRSTTDPRRSAVTVGRSSDWKSLEPDPDAVQGEVQVFDTSVPVQ